ncbi:pilus assembly protein TadG-related protein [Dongia deserti]|uniref:pilus assembly protein TadG-related protein n=1 Tax=Dongia deserti TaxID=2268030 RepID=UPI000E64A421|nr:pilus assembly protein TadG-related protein [Dongia deserti]
MKKLRVFSKNLQKLRSCQHGAVAPLVGVCAILLVAAVGVAVDVGRGQVAQSKLQAALDSAGLAAGAVVSQNPTEEELKPIAEQYLKANFGGKTIDAALDEDGFVLQLSEDERVVTLSATATMPTTFMRIFGHTSIEVAARSEITREMKGLEVALVLDVTGSMGLPVSPSDSTPKISVLKESARNMMDILFGQNSTVEDLWVSIVPFSHNVNIGTSHTDWLADYAGRAAKTKCIGPNNHANWSHTHSASEPAMHYCPTNGPHVSTRTNPHTLVDDWMIGSPSSWYFRPHAWSGCVLERWATGDDVTDASPTDLPFITFFFPDTPSTGTTNIGLNDWRADNGNRQVNSSRSANKDCVTSTITPATNVKSTIVGAINALSAGGNTLLPTGAVWGWRILSPEWQGKWGGTMNANGLPLDYENDLMDKAMVFMTDGRNEMPPCAPSNSDGIPWNHSVIMTAYGTLCQGNLGTTNQTAANNVLNAKTAEICAAMKEKGIIIYTIVFGSGSSTEAKELMENCASKKAYYYYAESAAALDGAFSSIGDSLSNLRVSK